MFNKRVLAYLHGTDEDRGQGDSEMFMCLKGVVFLGYNIMVQELLEIADWLQRAFFF